VPFADVVNRTARMTLLSIAFIDASPLRSLDARGKALTPVFWFLAMLGFSQRSGRIRSAERAEAHLQHAFSITFFQPGKRTTGAFERRLSCRILLPVFLAVVRNPFRNVRICNI
jgi:hypothetical protein